MDEGKPAVEDYLCFLKSGGTDSPIELLKIAGVDMASPKPIEDAMEVFNNVMDEFESDEVEVEKQKVRITIFDKE